MCLSVWASNVGQAFFNAYILNLMAVARRLSIPTVVGPALHKRLIATHCGACISWSKHRRSVNTCRALVFAIPVIDTNKSNGCVKRSFGLNNLKSVGILVSYAFFPNVISSPQYHYLFEGYTVPAGNVCFHSKLLCHIITTIKKKLGMSNRVDLFEKLAKLGLLWKNV